MKSLTVISEVSAYLDENGIAQLNFEDCSRGLGFTTVATSGNECVRWDRVNSYLSDLGFPHLVGKEFIPENVFYRLAMKARNETAELFQAKVADEILPSIRKHGTYMTPEVIERTLTDPDYIIKLATVIKTEREARLVAEHKILELKPKADFYDTVTGSKDSIDIGTVAKVLNFGKGRNTLFKILREHKILMANNVPYQEFCDRGYFRVIESTFTKSNGDTCISYKTVVFQRGIDFIRRFLIKNSYMKEAV
jgi:phage antirepressor YoqD-like protein